MSGQVAPRADWMGDESPKDRRVCDIYCDVRWLQKGKLM